LSRQQGARADRDWRTGFGRQFGQLAVGRADAKPKVRLEILLLDDDAETLVEAIAKHAGTETIGDGNLGVHRGQRLARPNGSA
jgi:nitrogen regulatory protein PII